MSSVKRGGGGNGWRWIPDLLDTLGLGDCLMVLGVLILIATSIAQQREVQKREEQRRNRVEQRLQKLEDRPRLVQPKAP